MSDVLELSELSSDECYALLADRHVGRLGVIVDGYPLIIPVNYATDLFTIVIRSRPGTKLAAAEHGNVTFQVDEFEHGSKTGWSVLVRGQAEIVTPEHSPAIRAATERTGLVPWAPGDGYVWVRIISHGITGRRIAATGGPEEWWLGTAAYM